MSIYVYHRLRARLRGRVFRTGAGRIIAIGLVIAAVLYIASSIAVARARPIIAIFAKAEAREYIVRAMNDAVVTELGSGQLRYEELITLEKDEHGAVSALIADMAKINLLQSKITNRVAINVVNILNTRLSVHMGDVVGGVLFSGRGPQIPVKIQSVNDVHTELKNSFESAGINQTRHRITLEITVEIDILIPGGKTEAAVMTEVTIAETIIVGDVPNFYTNAM